MTESLTPQSLASHREVLAPACVSRLREVAADTIRVTSGNARAAAIDMQIHEGHLSRSLKDGTIRLEQLEALGPAFAARFGQELVEKFGPLVNPKTYAYRLCDEIQALVNQLRQFIDQAEGEAHVMGAAVTALVVVAANIVWSY
jgi:hypothetical protein